MFPIYILPLIPIKKILRIYPIVTSNITILFCQVIKKVLSSTSIKSNDFENIIQRLKIFSNQVRLISVDFFFFDRYFQNIFTTWVLAKISFIRRKLAKVKELVLKPKYLPDQRLFGLSKSSVIPGTLDVKELFSIKISTVSLDMGLSRIRILDNVSKWKLWKNPKYSKRSLCIQRLKGNLFSFMITLIMMNSNKL